MSETITGEVKRITYESEETSFRVIRIDVAGRGPLTAVGRFQFVAVGSAVRISGEFTQDPRHGEQFKVHTLVTLEPETLSGLEKYLGSGLIPGVGPALAKRIVDTFGLSTLSVLDEKPERLREVPGLGGRRRREIEKRWREQRALGNLNVLLSSHGISPKLAKRIFDHYGDRTAEIVQTSPYRLAMDVRGIGFRTADRIARSLGIKSDHPERAQAGVHHQLYEWTERGHVFARRSVLAESTAELLGIDVGHTEAAIDALWASGRFVVERPEDDADDANDSAVYPAPLHRAELGVAERLLQLQQFAAVELHGVEGAMAEFERAAKIELAKEQRRAIETAATHKVVVITGGPGVGKTTIVRAVLSVFEKHRITTRLAAPTGRAAKRLSEATSRGASTLHRLLEFDPKLRRFQRDEDNPIDAQAVIVDEASMIDLPLARSLLSALPEKARLVIVGDADQLPSVGPGAVLRDLIQSRRVAVVALTRIFRQADRSLIAVNAHAILQGEVPQGADSAASGNDFFVIGRSDPDRAAQTIDELVTQRIPQRFGLDPRSDVQVLSPMHRGVTGTIELNRRLQQLLNPEGPSVERSGQVLRVGDRVMQLKNDYDKEVYNGDQGRVAAVDVESGGLSIEFDERTVEYEAAELENVTLAYATTIHKSQGSEYPAVVIPMLTTHFVMLSRNLLYTAVTRARKLCVLVCSHKALDIALSETRKEQRNTLLERRLRRLITEAGSEVARTGKPA